MDPFSTGDPIAYAEFMKVQGNKDFKNGNYSIAIKKYDEAIRVMAYIGQTTGLYHSREMAVLLCNRSNAFYNLNKWKEAYHSAEDSLQWDPSYVKGYYRIGYSLIQMSRPLDAARIFCQGLNLLHHSSDVGQVSEFIVGVFTSVNNVRAITPNILSICKKIVNDGYSPLVWQQVIEKLVRKGLWQSCLLLAAEKDKLPANLRIATLSLKDLFEKYVLQGHYERMERVPKLVEWLISIGASVESLGSHPLHAVIMLCIRAKGNHLFRWLLDHKPELKSLVNQQNEDGSTLLHIVASQCNGYSLKNQIEDVGMLLSAGVNPTICDKQSRSAMDILKRNKKFKVLDIINKHISRQMLFTESPAGTESTSSADVTTLLQDAFDEFVQFCSENAARNISLLKHEKVQNLLRLLGAVKEIPGEIACEIPPALASRFIKLLLKKQRWHEVLLLLTRKTAEEEVVASEDGFLKNCNLSDFDIVTVLEHVDRSDKRRIQLVKCLMERGASPEGTGAVLEKPLQKCLKKNDFELSYLLLTSGADPRSISIVEGDTPLHAALSIFFDKNDYTGFQFLQFLLELYDSNPSAFPYLNPNTQDKSGNTVLHIIFQKNPTKQIKKMLVLLAKFDMNLNLKNSFGRDVRYKRKKNDPMLVAWNEAVAEARKKCRHDGLGHQVKTTPAFSRSEAKSSVHYSAAQVSKTQPTKLSQEKEAEAGTIEVTEDATVKNSALADSHKPLTLRECLVHEIMQLIQKLALHDISAKMDSAVPEVVNRCSSMDKGERSGDDQIYGQAELVHNGRQDGCLTKDGPGEGSHEGFDKPKLEEEEEDAYFEGDEQLQNIKAHIQDFDKMTWEIECTSEMLKKLGSKHMPPQMKNKAIYVIQQLGNGEWTQGLQKRLDHLKSDIQLYEARLSKGARMLWEVAIDFSPRCSDSAETIMENEHATHPAEKTGRVYTEIIRIWDIELDHNKLNRAIEVICTAYKRGRSCILRKKLKGVGTVPISSNVKTQKRFPRIYVEDTKADKSKDSFVPEYFPPASAIETEYNIMKFHSFSTNMALNIINDMTSAVEYPFRVGELEYAVIDLNPKPLEPIILIGRSGTGKTTCCLYRLWKKFHSYWVKAQLAEGPLLVRQIWQKLKFNMQLEDKDSKEEDPDDCDPVDSVDLETSLSTDNEQEADEEEPYSSAVEDSDVNSSCDCDEEEECAAELSGKLEHLHQVFVTKNHVLCHEVQRNFIELSKSSKVTSHFKPLEANVYRLQDVRDENFPLFLTSKQLLLLLDASLPDPFFLRNEDGSLKHTIAGWSTKEDATISNWQEEDEDIEVDYDEDEKTADVQTRESDPRVFVTYSVFAKEIWPEMVKGRHFSGKKYNPALVWKEIKSFLKGSFEAMNSPQGILSEEDYKKLGRKRSPNFKEDRSEIYQLFCLYQQIKCQGSYFDEEDVLHKLFQRLSKLSILPWCIHELYGDEIQDFTQAELALLMKCIDDPNAMFLTGDTAQSIMEGVAFRFSDLRSLFHYASKSSNEKKQCIVRKPRRIYQLYQNYRSHSGILYMASGIVDLLQYYFPESFDRLPRDRGLFDGPKPTVLESCSVSDLAILLRGNKRRTQPIEFGAHQVILVANETAKEKIPEELSLALVLTIYEAKGLEFDDVLLYNFFTDSEAYKEWKIISSFPVSCSSHEETELILETSLEKDTEPERKLLLPNPEMYKMLNGELKQLYTAITRARVNLWIFDENSDRRAPAFQYFIKRELVQVVETGENKDLDDTMFVKTSTPEEWVAQGEYYAKHQCWKVAAKCYQKGGATEKEKLALAHDAVLNVQSKKISPKEKQMEYMDLAKTYLECGEPNLALKCLFHAKEYQLSAQLCEKLGKVKEAAYFYKRGQCYKDAYRCFEEIQEFDLAIKMCCQEELYEEAAKSVERYERMLQQEKKLSSKLSYTANQFYLEAAAKYLHANKTSDMMVMLSHLGTEDQLVFLKAHKQFSEAADLLKKNGRDEEAAKLMKQHGFVLEAAKLTNQLDFRASCLLAAARRCMSGSYKLENLSAVLNETLDLCERTNQRAGRAEAMYLMGVLKKDFHTLEGAFRTFLEVNHNAGAVEALFQAARCEGTSEDILRLASYGIEALLNLVKAFQKADTNAEREMVKSCFEYFGIVPVDKKHCQVTQNEAGCVLEAFSEMFNLREKKQSDQQFVNVEDVETMLKKHLLKRLTAVARLLFELRLPNVCPKFIAGLKCEDSACEDFHRVLLYPELKSVFHCKIYLAAINGLLLEAKQMFPKDLFHEASALDELLTADKYALCRSLVNAIFPKHFHLRMISETPLACKSVLTLRGGSRSCNPARMALREYIRMEFKNETAQNRRESTDLWLKAMQVLSLSSSYPEEFEKLLKGEEDDYNRELKLAELRGRGKRKGVEGKYGMLIPDKYAGSNERIHLCFIRLLQNSIDQLYVHQNPEQCKWRFFRFMNVLVKKCVDPLIPSIGNTVTLLEFQFLVGCAVLMRLCKNMTLCLPKSYIALFHYWDFLFTKGARHKDIFSIIQGYKPENTKQAVQEFKFHLKYLADVLCKYETFNVLLDAFNDLDYITSGEAERTVVFCLVMLVNADQVLSWKYKMILVEHFPSLKESLIKMREEYPSKVPERLFKIVDLVSRVPDVKEVVRGLKDLLYCRDEEFLVDCSWRWDHRGARGSRFEDSKEIRGIYFKITDLNRFSCLAQAECFEEPEAEPDHDMYVDEREDPLADIASVLQQKQQQKAFAKQKLQRLFLFIFCCVRWKRMTISKPEPLEMASGVFKKADIDTTQCDLCGVKFLQSEPLDKEPTEPTMPTEVDWEGVGERNENLVADKTYESHIRLDIHRNNCIAYQKYCEYFGNMVEPLINNGRNVLERIADATRIKGRFTAKEDAKLVRRKIEEGIKSISDMVEDLYKRKEWADAEETMSKWAEHLKSNVDDGMSWVEKAESSLLKEEDFDLDKDLESEVKDEGRTFEELYHKKPSRKKGKSKRK